MTDKKKPTIKQLLAEQVEPAQSAPFRTIWNTSCGGYPAGELIAISAGGGESAPKARKPAKSRAKIL